MPNQIRKIPVRSFNRFNFQMKTQDADQNGGLGHKNASAAGIRGCVAIKCSADDVNVPEDVIILVQYQILNPGRTPASYVPYCDPLQIFPLQISLSSLLPVPRSTSISTSFRKPGIGPFPLLLIPGCWGKQQIII